jgi:integrase
VAAANSDVSKLLRELADAGLPLSKTQKILRLFEQNSRKPSLPILDAEPRPVVFSGEMAKTKRSTKPHIYWRSGIPGKGATARVLIYTKVCLPDGRITKQNIAHNLGKVTLAEAERMRDELMENKALTDPPVSAIAVEQFITGYYYPSHVATLRRGGQKTAHEILPHFIQAFGKRRLQSITVIDVQHFLNLKAARYSRSTVSKMKAQISGVFRFAMALDLDIPKNPASLARVPSQCAQTEPERITPRVAEAQKLRATLAKPGYSPMFEMMALGSTTSFGFSELAALRWQDVNLTDQDTMVDGSTLEACTVWMRRSYYRGEFGPAKNKGRQRKETIGQKVVEALAGLRNRSSFTKPDSLVFTRTGSPLDYHQILRQLKKACGEAGIREVGWHGFRRYFATATEGRMSQEDRQRTMGQNSSAMLEHYTAADLKRRAPAVQAITDELFADPSSGY